MASFFVLFCLSFALVVPSSLCVARPATWTGGITEVPRIDTNVEVQELGRFSVEEHNRREHAHLSFQRVVEAQRQVVSGVKYYLRIEAEEGGAPRLFNAAVVVKAWLRSVELVSFESSS
ncbi:cysteine proteinase inhibitor 4-like [Nymphaea colorata]|uniref:cysteine proteinase inhibitor 4-like n=1 Tax=Nymphaea colorata TaxID=210225 RepID=UPI00129D4D95|nr:cysteine proteinase inhibitor 4-like [Nymphaea colorata]